MQLRSLHALLGPNLWSREAVVTAEIEATACGELRYDVPAGCGDRLLACLPELKEQPDRFVDRLRRGLPTGDVVARVAAELQAVVVGTPRAPALSIGNDTETLRIVVPCEDPPVTRACLRAACDLVASAVAGRSFDVAKQVERLRETANLICLGPTTGTIVRAARERGIPTRRLDDGSLVLLGYGAKQHRIRMAVTDRTGAIPQDIAQDKELTKQLLRDIGVPTPMGRAVESAADAWRAACEIGGPVVVKPRNANHGRGVTINLTSREQVEKAFTVAEPEGDGVLVEEFAVGAEHRLLVVDGRMVAASRAEPEQVVGDGVRTITQLVDELNADPRRGEDWASPLCIVELDPPARLLLEQQGYKPESIPARGATVLIHYNGEFLTDVTDQVHPALAAACVLAARVIGLNIAGIDMIARDISLPPDEQEARIIEVNSGPGMRMHFDPQFGKPRPVGQFIIDGLFTRGDDGRIPIAAVAGGPRAANIARLVREQLLPTRPHLGLVGTDGLWVGRHQLKSDPCDQAASGRALLLHPDVDAAVFALSDESIRRDGLAFDLCTVAVLPTTGDPEIRRLLVEAVHPERGTVVLEPGDAAGAKLAADAGRKVVTAAAADDAALAAAVVSLLNEPRA